MLIMSDVDKWANSNKEHELVAFSISLTCDILFHLEHQECFHSWYGPTPGCWTCLERESYQKWSSHTKELHSSRYQTWGWTDHLINFQVTSSAQATCLARRSLKYLYKLFSRITFLAKPIVVTLKHRPAHPKIGQLYGSAWVYQAVSAGNVSVNIL